MVNFKNLGPLIIVAGLITQLVYGWQANMYATILVVAGLIIGILTLLRITVNGLNTGGKGTIITLSIVLGLLMVFGVTASPLMSALSGIGSSAQTGSVVETNVQTSGEGAMSSAAVNLYVKDVNGEYAGTGTIFALKSGVVADRNDLMKKLYDGNTGDLIPRTMSQSSGTYTFNGFNARVDGTDQVCFAGYKDNAPAATDNVSFVSCRTITGMTAGSTPSFMLSDSSYTWYSYPTLLFYDGTDTAYTGYNESEASAVEKTLTFYMFPTNNGEAWTDAALWLESPEANIAAIKRVEITPQGGSTVTYGMPTEVTSSENKFRAQPALTTSTDKMYYVGAIPDSVRLSTTQKAKIDVKVTYDHPASAAAVLMYFKVTQNTNALTSSGGHYDSPATNLKLNLSDDGTDGFNNI